jgi:hypothetical protein
MKAKPVKLLPGEGYIECLISEATHITLNFPGPVGLLTLPIIIRGTRDGTNCWTWNGSIETPTLKPSILTTNHEFRCHTWITNGKACFLDDTSHDLRGQTLDLLDV